MKLTKTEAIAALDAIAKTEIFRPNDIAYAVRYVENTDIVPDWLENYNPSKWFVRHCGRTYETSAKSEFDAVNHIRFNLYGKTPESSLSPFVAICPSDIIYSATRAVRINEGREDEEKRTTTDLFGRHTMSKQEAINRMKKMIRKAS